MSKKRYGVDGTSEYRVWRQMRMRCELPTHRQFKDYGGRGIQVCERWQVFVNFLADMGPRPSGRSLDRRENDQGYSPENCRWATKEEQATNKRSTRWADVDGKKVPLIDLARQAGLNPGTVYARIDAGWSWQDAVGKTVKQALKERPGAALYSYMGETRSLTDWAQKLGVSKVLLSKRLDRGWTFKQAVETPNKKNPESTVRRRLISFSGKTQSLTAWARELGIPYGTLKRRFHLGWRPEVAFTTPWRKPQGSPSPPTETPSTCSSDPTSTVTS